MMESTPSVAWADDVTILETTLDSSYGGRLAENHKRVVDGRTDRAATDGDPNRLGHLAEIAFRMILRQRLERRFQRGRGPVVDVTEDGKHGFQSIEA